MATTGASFGAKPMYLEEYDKHLKFEVNKNIFNNDKDMGYSRSRKI